ncbi:hypothetical protein K461DRAFT_163108 [Myriangium duriaei CBS 260.36]|uniref:Uncharacterized protein n=1 Tax=Myriangium duriaei CBS 260.36 TaxID=1168546 RepID=A0A9P4MGJ1_9PEZI|nr:hypothetical protein K461DRAFT_163108 [Myriangium duriaei CBS 260.36]
MLLTKYRILTALSCGVVSILTIHLREAATKKNAEKWEVARERIPGEAAELEIAAMVRSDCILLPPFSHPDLHSAQSTPG